LKDQLDQVELFANPVRHFASSVFPALLKRLEKIKVKKNSREAEKNSKYKAEAENCASATKLEWKVLQQNRLEQFVINTSGVAKTMARSHRETAEIWKAAKNGFESSLRIIDSLSVDDADDDESGGLTSPNDR